MAMRFLGKQASVGSRSRATATGLATISWFLLQSLMPLPPVLAQAESEGLTYGQFLEEIEQGEVKAVEIDEARGIAYVTLDSDAEDAEPQEVELFSSGGNAELVSRLRANDVDVDIRDSSGSGALAWLATNSLLAL
ncbi:MAG: ATP-dependent metallopeptidase FtsH/Yme1/Tma family protein, partial [Nodosilinea sp.]